MKKVIVLLVCCIFWVASFCFASDLKKVDNPTVEMLQGKWEGKFERTSSKRFSGPFEMKFKGNKALVTRGAVGTDPITQWVVTIDKIEKGKIYMSNERSEFEIALFTNGKAESFIEGNYSGRKAGALSRANSDIKLQRVSKTVDDKDIPADANK